MEIGEAHLTYCTNCHPGETLSDVIANIDRYVVPVKRQVAPDVPFGMGLRLSWEACRELVENDRLEEFRDLCRERGLYVFTLNGFIYGHFHGRPVKREVYRPAWYDARRLAYTGYLARILAYLLPPDTAGTISTVPVGFSDLSEDEREEAAQLLLRQAADLHYLCEETGKMISLALEPEPSCVLEDVGQTVDFFQRRLFAAGAISRLQNEIGRSRDFCESLVRKYLGICYDACHMALAREKPDAALNRLEQAGIGVVKFHLSAAPEIEFFAGDPSVLELLRPFCDDIYLHQVVEKCGERLTRFVDLPQAIESLAGRADNDLLSWRIHFHIPIFLERMGNFSSTRQHAADLLAHSRNKHLEVETYTWQVLPPEYRDEDLPGAIARELKWVIGRLG